MYYKTALPNAIIQHKETQLVYKVLRQQGDDVLALAGNGDHISISRKKAPNTLCLADFTLVRAEDVPNATYTSFFAGFKQAAKEVIEQPNQEYPDIQAQLDALDLPMQDTPVDLGSFVADAPSPLHHTIEVDSLSSFPTEATVEIKFGTPLTTAQQLYARLLGKK